jgi:hypothetical protein
MTTLTGMRSDGVEFDAVRASPPPDRMATNATTTTTTKKLPVRTNASCIGLTFDGFRISRAPNQTHMRSSTLSQAQPASPLPAQSLLGPIRAVRDSADFHRLAIAARPSRPHPNSGGYRVRVNLLIVGVIVVAVLAVAWFLWGSK